MSNLVSFFSRFTQELLTEPRIGCFQTSQTRVQRCLLSSKPFARISIIIFCCVLKTISVLSQDLLPWWLASQEPSIHK